MLKQSMFVSLVLALVLAAGPAWTQDSSLASTQLADLNQDGVCSVLDVQAAACQVLRTLASTAQADINGDGEVDVRDLQNVVNTALGTGGMMQRIQGVLDYDREAIRDRVRILAASEEGERVEGDVSPETGEFRIAVRVGRSWRLSFIGVSSVAGANGVYTSVNRRILGTIVLPNGDREEFLLPLPDVSEGDVLDLGRLELARWIRAHDNVMALLRRLNRQRQRADYDENGLPDFLQPLLDRVYGAADVPSGMRHPALVKLVAPCIKDWLEVVTDPSREDLNENGVPDFVEPLLECIAGNLKEWFEANGHEMPPADEDGNGRPDVIDRVLLHVRMGIAAWLNNLDFPNLNDSDGDGVPDRVQAMLARVRERLDRDGNGIPDFSEDADGDGIPNWLDDDTVSDEDDDGDGIPNEDDVDDDNDGVPDYAQNSAGITNSAA